VMLTAQVASGLTAFRAALERHAPCPQRRRRAAEEEVPEEGDRIGDVQPPVAVRVEEADIGGGGIGARPALEDPAAGGQRRRTSPDPYPVLRREVEAL